VSERRRHDLYQRLERVLGREEASTLMEHLPPVAWTDVVTRRDLDEALAAQDARIEARIADATRVIIMWMVGVMVPLFAALFAAVVSVR